MEVVVSRKQIIEHTAQNLIEALIAKPNEYDAVVEHLLKLDYKDLLTAMMESWKFRSDCKQPIRFCPISLPIERN